MELGALRLAFILEAERRGLLPLDATLSLAHEAPDTGRLAALQALLMSGDATLGIPSFAGTLLDPAIAGSLVPIPKQALEETLHRLEGWDLHAVGRLHETSLANHQRKRQGSFFTPKAIARALVEHALSTHTEPPTLLDPTMGCGAFLLEAFRHLKARHPEAKPAELALGSLHGVDRDPVAVGLAVLGLWLAIGDPSLSPGKLQANLRSGDSLLYVDWQQSFRGPMSCGGFEAVIGNPPFVNIERLEPDERAAYRAAYPRLKKRFDLYVAAAERSLDLLRPGGTLGLVLPSAMLTQEYAEPLRQRLLEEATIRHVLPHPRVEDWGVPTIGLVADHRKAPPEHRIQVENRSVPQAVYRRLPGLTLRIDRTAEELEAAARQLSEGIPLGRVAIATWGVRGVPIATFHKDSPEGPHDRPMLKGDCLREGQLAWKGKYLRYEPEALYRPLFPELFERPKVVIAKVTGDRGLEAALDTDGFYTDDSLICVQPKYQLADLDPAVIRRHRLSLDPEDVELSRVYPVERLIELLQSPELQDLFAAVLGNRLNVYPESVKRLPLPR